MKPPIEFRPTRIQTLKARVAEVNRPALESREHSPPLPCEAHRVALMPKVLTAPGSVNRVFTSDAAEELARRRSQKAAQMRRWRAKQKAAKVNP